MNTEQTGIIILSSLIVIIYSIRLVMYLKNKRYKSSKHKYGLTYRKEDFVPVTFLKAVYEPDREYDVCEEVKQEWVRVHEVINLN